MSNLRAALVRLGFSTAAATELTDKQGMNNLTEYELLDDEEVTNLCKTLRRPGGLVPDPDDTTEMIQDPGVAITPRAETNLKLMVYYLRYRTRVSRPKKEHLITLESVRGMKDHHRWEKDHKQVEAPKINPKDWPSTIDSIEEYLRGCLGVTKIPLAYVIRDNMDVAADADDPTDNYESKQEELIARAPILTGNAFTPTYLADRARVWELLSEITRNEDCWSYVRPAQRTRDGRMAFLGLRGHYLGTNNVDNMSTSAEHKLQNTAYHGEKRRWNFEKFVRIHVDQHQILNGLVQHGYSGIDERSKVRLLLNGIKTRSLDIVKTTIMADPTLRSDFDRCVNLFKDFIKQTGLSGEDNAREANVSAIRSGDSGTKTQVEADMTVEDRYYTKAEYDKLTPARKLGLKRKREARNHKPGSKSSKVKNDKHKGSRGGMNLSKRSVKALATQLSKLQDDADIC